MTHGGAALGASGWTCHVCPPFSLSLVCVCVCVCVCSQELYAIEELLSQAEGTNSTTAALTGAQQQVSQSVSDRLTPKSTFACSPLSPAGPPPSQGLLSRR